MATGLVVITKIRIVQQEVAEAFALIEFIAIEMIISSLKQSVEYPSTSAELVSCWSYVDAVEVLIRPPCCVMES